MSAVAVLSADFFKKDTEVFTVDGTKEKRAEALCFDSDSNSEEVNGLDDDDFDKVHLVSNDGERFEVRKKSALMSKLVEAVLEGDPSATEIPLRKVDSRALAFIVEHMEHHFGRQPAEISKPIRSYCMQRNVDNLWDAEFANKRTMGELFSVILATSYMDCHSLFHLFCCKVGTLIKGRSTEEIREITNEKNKEKIVFPVCDESIGAKPVPSHSASESAHSEDDTKETADKMDDSTVIGTEDDTKEVATELPSAE